MNWSKKKTHWFDNLRNHLWNFNTHQSTLNSHLHPISTSTQTPARKSRHRKYQHRFNKCLKELLEKYPPYPSYDYFVREHIDSNLSEKLYQSREDLIRLNQILEDLDKRLEILSSMD